MGIGIAGNNCLPNQIEGTIRADAVRNHDPDVGLSPRPEKALHLPSGE